MCKSIHIECYLHDEVPEEKLVKDVVPETDVVPGTNVVPGGRARNIRNVFENFSNWLCIFVQKVEVEVGWVGRFCKN